MILANAFCLFFFLGKYLQVASLGGHKGLRAFSRPLEAGHAGVGLGAANRAPRETPGERAELGTGGLGIQGGELPGRLWRRELCSG